MIGTLRNAWQRVTLLRVLEQVALCGILFLLAVVWLNLSDGSVLNLLATTLLAIVMVVLAGVGETWVASRIVGVTASRKVLLRGLAAFVLLALVWIGLSVVIDNLSIQDGLRAGFINSKAPRGLRTVLTYEHLELWMGWAWSLLKYVVTALAGAALFAAVFAHSGGRGTGSILRSGSFWLVAVVGSFACLWLRDTLMRWVPGHSLGIETVSLVLRLSFVVAMVAAFVCYLLAVMAACTAEPGTPETSQLRTADRP